MVIAAYYEIHPLEACVIIAYDDTTRTSAKKMSYINDSIFEIKELIKTYYNEFRIKGDSTESYVITPTTVSGNRQSGTLGSTAEYERVDIN